MELHKNYFQNYIISVLTFSYNFSNIILASMLSFVHTTLKIGVNIDCLCVGKDLCSVL